LTGAFFSATIEVNSLEDAQMKKTHIDYPINDDTLYRLADLFKVFGDPTRIRILYVLSVEELCVQDIADRLSMTQSAISHQLRVLKQMSLVKFRSDGKTIYYSLTAMWQPS